jgi:hypothetical protein
MFLMSMNVEESHLSALMFATARLPGPWQDSQLTSGALSRRHLLAVDAQAEVAGDRIVRVALGGAGDVADVVGVEAPGDELLVLLDGPARAALTHLGAAARHGEPRPGRNDGRQEPERDPSSHRVPPPVPCTEPPARVQRRSPQADGALQRSARDYMPGVSGCNEIYGTPAGFLRYT